MVNKNEVDKMKDQFKKAAEISKVVPENMQEAAFHRALDVMLGHQTSQPANATINNLEFQKPTIKPVKSDKKKKISFEDNEYMTDLLTNLNSTKYPDINSNKSVLENSLRILKAVLEDHNLDGLTAQDITNLLKAKFRISVTYQAVNWAFKNTSNLVDRAPQGRSYIYRIMDPGLQFLTEGKETTKPIQKKSPTKKKVQNLKPEDSKSKDSKTKKTPGPKAILTQLIDEGFFDQPQKIGDVIEHIKDNMGYSYKSTNLSMTFTRLIRDKELSREKNDEGQYVYKRK